MHFMQRVLGHQALRVHRVLKEYRGNRVSKEFRENKDFKDFKENKLIQLIMML